MATHYKIALILAITFWVSFISQAREKKMYLIFVYSCVANMYVATVATYVVVIDNLPIKLWAGVLATCYSLIWLVANSV